MTPEERESIISEAVERAIKLTPELAQQLVVQRMSQDKLKLAFLEKLLGEDERYKRWTVFIREVVAKHEAANPGNLAKALEDSIPEIQTRVTEMEKLDFKKIERPSDLTFKAKAEDDSVNGVL